MNISAFFAPVTAGLMRQRYGWSAAFATAGVGMVVGLVICASLPRGA